MIKWQCKRTNCKRYNPRKTHNCNNKNMMRNCVMDVLVEYERDIKYLKDMLAKDKYSDEVIN